MNNLDTQTALLEKKFYFFKVTENFLYKRRKRPERSGRNQSNDLLKAKTQQDIIQLKPGTLEDVKDLKFIIQYHLRINW